MLRVVLSWQLQPVWSANMDMTKASEVAIEFVAIGPETTRLEFEHRHLQRRGDGWERCSLRPERKVDGL